MESISGVDASSSSPRQLLIVLAGVVGSGKSTFAHALVDKVPGWARVNQDDLGDRRACEDMVKMYLSQVSPPYLVSCWRKADALSPSQGLNVVLDRQNFDVSQRRSWLEIAVDFPAVDVACLVMGTSPQDCHDRLLQRTGHPTIGDSQLAIDLLEKFLSLWVSPTLNEGFDFLRTLPSLPNSSELSILILSSLLITLRNSTRNPEAAKQRAALRNPRFVNGGSRGGYELGIADAAIGLVERHRVTNRHDEISLLLAPSCPVVAGVSDDGQCSSLAARPFIMRILLTTLLLTTKKIPRESPDTQLNFKRATANPQFERRQVQGFSLPFPQITIPGFPLLAPLVVTIPGVITFGRKIIPDAAHQFVAPGPTDQRGGCPGLNLMANYGYIPHNGIVSTGQLLYALQEALGFAPDTAGLLTALAFRGMTDVTTLRMSIGKTDSRTNGPLSLLFGQAPGLFDYASHTKYEIDGSILYDDEFLVPTHFGGQANTTKWQQLAQLADTQYGGLMNLPWNAEVRYERYLECVANNPQCSWLPVGQALFYAAETLTYSLMPSGAVSGPSQNDPATTNVVSTFFGMKLNPDGTYSKVPETFPPSADGHWWRRELPLTGPELAAGLAGTYLAHPVAFGANQGTTNSFLVATTPSQTLAFEDPTGAAALCLVIDSIVENIPIAALNLQTQIIPLVNALLAPIRGSMSSLLHYLASVTASRPSPSLPKGFLERPMNLREPERYDLIPDYTVQYE
ncbi:unspecific peroxygenase, partial [Phenoliferia sp. Uapishka_3]